MNMKEVYLYALAPIDTAELSYSPNIGH